MNKNGYSLGMRRIPSVTGYTAESSSPKEPAIEEHLSQGNWPIVNLRSFLRTPVTFPPSVTLTVAHSTLSNVYFLNARWRFSAH